MKKVWNEFVKEIKDFIGRMFEKLHTFAMWEAKICFKIRNWAGNIQ